ncbi:MAG: MFS transporter [Candidatus Melainabacteria bacterium]|nr:MFS transporter [Candidatus Melainabacteria bacterium]
MSEHSETILETDRSFDPSPASLEARTRWHALWASWLGCLFDGLDASIFAIVLYPAMSELLKVDAHSTVGYYASFILAAFLVGWALGGLVLGRLADQIGRVKTLILSILVYTIFTGLCALSQSWQEMALYRFFVGFGIGGELSVGAIMLSEHWKGSQRLHALSFMATSWGCGYFAAGLLNWCLGDLSWRYLFAAGIVPALLTLYVRLKLKESEDFKTFKRYREELKRRVHLTEEDRAFLSEPLKEILGRENLRALIVVVAITSSGIIGYWSVLSWVPAWINQLTQSAAVYERSLASMVMNAGTIFGAASTGFIILRLGRRATVALGLSLTLICCQGLFLTCRSFGMPLLIWLFFCGFFSIMSAVTICIYVPEIFHTRLCGTAFGVAFNIGRIFGAVAALASGQLIVAFDGSYARAASTVACVYVVGIVASLFIRRTSGEPLSGLPCRSEPNRKPAFERQTIESA